MLIHAFFCKDQQIYRKIAYFQNILENIDIFV